MGLFSSLNATSAKLIGLGTVIIAIIMAGDWGFLAALVMGTGGVILFVGAGDSLSQFSIRGLALFGVYCFLVVLGLGIGAA